MLRLCDLNLHKRIFQSDKNGREINVYKIINSQFYNDNTYYPNVVLKSENRDVKPINEVILSLKDIDFNLKNKNLLEITCRDVNPHFLFIYNTDNYFHFIYDSLPYLISFFELRREIPNLKILMNYPNQQKTEHYKFVTDFLNLLSIYDEDITIVNPNTEYSEIYVSNSYTHDGKSNIPPRDEIYNFYEKIVKTVTKNYTNKELPTKIYISRRTWVSKDTSNIGTNYTTKRKLHNEDEIVNYLTNKGYVEIFTETISTIDKILLFNNAEHIIGPIGGGLCNSLFSTKKTKLTVLNSPFFFDINYRFLFSFKNINYEILYDSEHVEKSEIKKFMRVKFDDKVGEVVDINGNRITINYSNIDLAGWNNEIKFEQIIKNINDIIPLDKGLNSEWMIDIQKLKEKI